MEKTPANSEPLLPVENTQVPPPSSATLPHPRLPKPHHLRLLYPLFVGLLIVIIAGLFFWFGKSYSTYFDTTPSPTPVPVVESSPIPVPGDETAGWETYSNELVDFTFKYPSDWSATSCPDNPLSGLEPPYGNLLKLEAELSADCETDAFPSINISFWDWNRSDSETYVSDSSNAGFSAELQPDVLPYNAKKYLRQEKEPTPLPEKFMEIIIPVDSDSIVISFLPEYELVADQILSTFEFVEDPEAMSPSSSFVTYQNDYYAISFPPNWKAYNQAAGAGVSAALPNSLIVDISDTTQASRPYPNGVITIQVLDAMGTGYDNPDWEKTLTTINGLTTTKYENANEASVVYIFQSSPGAKYIEVLFRSSKDDSIYKTFEEIISTFTFTN